MSEARITPALRLEGITKAYPGVTALEDVSFEVLPGEAHGLAGKNGAGKSTLVGIMAGLIAPTSGSIQISGRTFRTLSRSRAKNAGIAIVTQEPELILDLSVAENLFLGALIASRGVVNPRAMEKKAEEVLSRYGLNIAPGYMAADLSLSERQLILILKACVLERSRVVILDEASAPLTPGDAALLRNLVNGLRDAGKAIVYISHHVDELLDVCDRLTVLRDGKAVATRLKKELTRASLSGLIVGAGNENPELARGGGSKFQNAARAGAPGISPADFSERLLRLENFTKWGAFEGVDLSLKKGEIVGLAGLRGSGRTELMKAIAGINPPDVGTMTFKGRENAPPVISPYIAYLPEERELEGLIRGFSVQDNITLNRLPSAWGVIRKGALHALAWKMFQAVQCKAASLEQDVDELSGGNRQKVLIGRIMASEPDLYLLDEPTKGVDIEAKKSILSIVAKVAQGGAGVLISSPGLDDLIGICDRICVLYKGRLTAEYRREEFNEKELFLAAQNIAS